MLAGGSEILFRASPGTWMKIQRRVKFSKGCIFSRERGRKDLEYMVGCCNNQVRKKCKGVKELRGSKKVAMINVFRLHRGHSFLELAN